MNKKLTNFPGLLKPRVSLHTFYNWLSLRKWSEVHCTGKGSLCSRDSHYKQQQFTWANYPATFIWSWIYLILKKYIRGKEGSRESMDLPKRNQPALTTGSSVQPHTFPLGNCCRENGGSGFRVLFQSEQLTSDKSSFISWVQTSKAQVPAHQDTLQFLTRWGEVLSGALLLTVPQGQPPQSTELLPTRPWQRVQHIAATQYLQITNHLTKRFT